MKRFTETTKWDDPWFRNLPDKYRSFWQFICDKCDNSGVWKVDMELAEFCLHSALDPAGILEYINNEKTRIKILDNGRYWLVVDFVAYQYGELHPESRPHQQVLDLIAKHEAKGYSTPSATPAGLPQAAATPKAPNLTHQTAAGIIAYLNQTAGKHFDVAAQANLRFIEARLRDGNTTEHLRKVIDIMTKDWLKDSKMCEYLRPETLFNPTKFATYSEKVIRTELARQAYADVKKQGTRPDAIDDKVAGVLDERIAALKKEHGEKWTYVYMQLIKEEQNAAQTSQKQP